MTEHDWQRSEARAHMMRAREGTPLPFANYDVMIDSVLHVFFVNVNGRLLTRSEVMIEGEHARDERRDQMRHAYRALRDAMNEHARKLGFGGRHDARSERITRQTTPGNIDRRTGADVHHDDGINLPFVWTSASGADRSVHRSGDSGNDGLPAKRSVLPRRKRGSQRKADDHATRNTTTQAPARRDTKTHPRTRKPDTKRIPPSLKRGKR